jgi:predicted cobalt transporter CbtA
MAAPGLGAPFTQLLRSSLVVAGMLLAGVGIGDTVAGRSKIGQYQELLRTTADPAPADPAALFPTASESQERHELARAKLGFYQLLLTVGQLLTVVGFVLMALGVLRLRFRALRPAPGPAP